MNLQRHKIELFCWRMEFSQWTFPAIGPAGRQLLVASLFAAWRKSTLMWSVNVVSAWRLEAESAARRNV